MSDEKKIKDGFLLKIDSIRKKTHGYSLFLKNNDVIVALNNELFTFGENALIEQLQETNNIKKKKILTICRDNIFFDVIATRSLGCKFTSTNDIENKDIQKKFSEKKIYDYEDLKEFTVFRDLSNNFDCIKNSNSIIPGLFPPLWLAYEQKWWLLGLFTVLSTLLLSVNFWFFLIGWLSICIYCYKGQSNLLFSFALLSGKAFCMKIASPDIHLAHKTIRSLYPKSKFKYSKLENPTFENEEHDNNSKIENNIDETNKALV